MVLAGSMVAFGFIRLKDTSKMLEYWVLMDGHDQSKPYVEPFVGGGNLFSEVPAKHKCNRAR